MARLCDRVEQKIREVIPPTELGRIVDNIGLPVSGINLAYSNSGQIGSEDADILITLKADHHPTADYVDTLRMRLPQLFPGSAFAFLPADIVTQILNFGSPAPIDVQIAGSDIRANADYAKLLLARIRKISGVADARIQQAFNEPTLNIDVNRELASEVGLTERDVTTSLQSTLAGSIQTAPTFWLNPRNGVSYPIVVQMPQYDMDTIGSLENLPVTSGASTALLGGLATIRNGWSDGVVSHYNVQPAVDIYTAVSGRDLGAVAADIRKVIQETAHLVPRGSSVNLRGQVSTMSSAYSQLIFGLAFAILLIYLLIVVNFQSWIDPLVIVTALPAALAGIVWMLFVTHTTLSVPALTGAIMCMGVATANSILIISFARERLATGLDAVTAAIEAGYTRFRPVLMTALAMIIGMAPMALSNDQNAPLGRAVIGGLLAATSATLLFVPVVFAIAHGNRRSSPRPHSPPIRDTALPSHT
jgi:multidrug efflux pump subunit AcrB